MPEHSLNFVAEVKEVKARKTASLDIEYRVVIVTDSPDVLSLGTLSGDQLISVGIDIEQ